MHVNRKKLKQSLGLLNVAVLIAATGYLPRSPGDGYSWSNQFERWLNRYTHNLPYGQILLVCSISLVATAAIYVLIDAIDSPNEEAKKSGWNASG